MFAKFYKLNLNKILWVVGGLAFAFLIIFLLWWQWESNIIGIKNEDQKPRASLTSLSCDNYERRPIAVMMASDPIARPLSGIGQADVVIEMPVTPNGITRMMAIFQCEDPKEIGSIRSARQDLISLAGSFGAIYAHWGGEKEALNNLDNGVIDNIDAMKYEGTVFYRKNSIPRPHNGFTTIELLKDKAKDLGYDLGNTFSGYLRTEEKLDRNLSNIVEMIFVDYEYPYDVKWTYDNNSNKYKRTRGGKAEIDINTGGQVEISTVVVMRTTSRVLSIDYISVNAVGEGEAEFYQNGIKTSGTWKNAANDLKFYDTSSQEMKFVPGKMWIEIVTK